MNSGPFSIRSLLGYPRLATTRSKTRVIRSVDKLISISMAKTSRLKSSTMLSVRKRRPSNKLLHIKSIDQRPLIVSDPVSWMGYRFGNRFLPRRLLFKLQQAIDQVVPFVIPSIPPTTNGLVSGADEPGMPLNHRQVLVGRQRITYNSPQHRPKTPLACPIDLWQEVFCDTLPKLAL